MAQLAESKQKYKDYYEEKLQIEYDEVDKLRAKNEDLQNQLQQVDYDADQQRQDLQDAQDQLA